VIAKLSISGAVILLVASVVLAAPAGADPDPKFNGLSCNGCPTPPTVTSPVVEDQIRQGLQDALAA
jgi:hypothetical protein